MNCPTVFRCLVTSLVLMFLQIITYAQTKDVVYAKKTDYQGNEIELKLDLYRPSLDDGKAKSVIVWLHGGGMYVGHKSVEWDPVTFLAEEFAHRGYVFVSADYRLNPEWESNGTFRETIADAAEDLSSVVEWINKNSSIYQMDSHNIILMGHSSGAEIVSNYYYSNSLVDEQQHDKSGIVAVVSVSGNRLFFDGKIHTGTGEAPCLIVHGDKDDINPLADAHQFLDQIGSLGTLTVMEGNGHTWTQTDDQKRFLVDAIVNFLK